MKELTQVEIASVSGAGLLANIGASIGNIIDRATSLGGKTTDYTTGFTILFTGIESITKGSILGGLNGIGQGVVAIVAAARHSASQK